MFIVVLGGGIDLQGNLPSYVYQRLNKAIELYKKHIKARIILSGRYSFLYGKNKPKVTEARAMQNYLLSKNIPRKNTLLETKSKDTIGNAYYLKKNIFLPKKERSTIIITSSFHLKRVAFIFRKIFGDNYDFKFIGVDESFAKKAEEKIIERQEELLDKTKEIMSTMKDGDHNFLKGKLYKIRYYRIKRPSWITDFVAKGKV